MILPTITRLDRCDPEDQVALKQLLVPPPEIRSRFGGGNNSTGGDSNMLYLEIAASELFATSTAIWNEVRPVGERIAHTAT